MSRDLSKQIPSDFEATRSFMRLYLEGGGCPGWIKACYREYLPNELAMLLAVSGLVSGFMGRPPHLGPVRGRVYAVDWEVTCNRTGPTNPNSLRHCFELQGKTPANLAESLLYWALNQKENPDPTISLWEDGMPVIVDRLQGIPTIFYGTTENVTSSFKILVVDTEPSVKQQKEEEISGLERFLRGVFGW